MCAVPSAYLKRTAIPTPGVAFGLKSTASPRGKSGMCIRVPWTQEQKTASDFSDTGSVTASSVEMITALYPSTVVKVNNENVSNKVVKGTLHILMRRPHWIYDVQLNFT